MAGKTATLAIKIVSDASKAAQGFDDAEKRTGRFGAAMGRMGALAATGAAAAGAAAVALGVAAFNAASDLQQAQGAVDAVFGNTAAKMHEMAKIAAQTTGLSEAEYSQMGSVIGSQLKNMGVAQDQLLPSTNHLITVGADLAAQFGGSTSDAVEALSSLLRGERDPIERYGVSMSQAAIDAQVAAMGLDTSTEAAKKNAQLQATLALLTQQTSSAQGAFARESDTAAGAQQRLSATWENAKATLGNALLPVVAQGATFLTGLLGPAMQQITDKNSVLGQGFAAVGQFVTTQMVPAITGLWNELGPKLIPILQQVGQFITGVVVPAFQAVWSIVQNYVFPIIASVLGPALAGVQQLFGILSEKVEENKGKFLAIYEKIKPFLDFLKNTVAPMIGTVLVNSFTVLSSVIGPVIDAITWVLDKAASVIGFVGNVGSAIGSFFSAPAAAGPAVAAGGVAFGAPAGGALYGAPVLGASAGAGTGGGPTAGAGLGTTNVTVNVTFDGIVSDPVATGRQLQSVLDRYTSATGRRPAGVGLR